ncbi:subtilase, partial [Helicosporidium sp. ATCC 50920]
AHRVTGGLPLGARATKAERVGPELWSLDRVDQRALPLDGYFKYGGSSAAATGEGVTIYVVDSGINVNHQEFQPYGGGPSRASYGYDFVDEDAEASDCDGHGTHVAASAVGLGVGVAKAAKVVAVRILDCSGSGSVTTTVAALDWVAAHAVKPAVVTLSLGISVGSWSKTLEDAARNLILDYGIPIVVASGNSGVDACYVAPANVPQVITVGGSDVAHKNVSMAALVGQRTLAPPAKSVSDSLEGSLVAQSVEAPSQLASLQAEQAGALELASLVECQAGLSSGADGPASALSQQRDTLYRWSNTGSCVDLFAPGVDVYSACGGERRCDAVGPHSYSLLSGTSMAVPQVAGLVAQFMQYRPEASPEEIHAAVVEGATQGVLDESLFEKGTPNRLLHTRIFPDEEEVQAAQGP